MRSNRNSLKKNYCGFHILSVRKVVKVQPSGATFSKLQGGGGPFSGAAREFFHYMGDAPMTRTRKAVPGREDEFRKGDVL